MASDHVCYFPGHVSCSCRDPENQAPVPNVLPPVSASHMLMRVVCCALAPAASSSTVRHTAFGTCCQLCSLRCASVFTLVSAFDVLTHIVCCALAPAASSSTVRHSAYRACWQLWLVALRVCFHTWFCLPYADAHCVLRARAGGVIEHGAPLCIQGMLSAVARCAARLFSHLFLHITC